MSNKNKSSRGKPESRVFATNRKAFFNYEVIDKVEAGIVLTGAEVKSIRSGQASLKESFVLVDGGEIWLWNCHLSQWAFSHNKNYEPARKRKLLLKRREIDRLQGKVKEKGLTLIPLKIYGKRGLIKVQVGLCRGRKKYDKRVQEKERTLKRDLHKQKREYMV